MKLFGSFVLAATVPYVVNGAGAVRGVLKNIEPNKEIRQLMKSSGGGDGDGGGGGNQSGNQSGNQGGGVASECPNFMKGWPSGVKNCQAEGNAGCAAPCGGSTSSTCCCVASNGYNFCGNPTDCNEWTTCIGGDHNTPVASSTNAEETIKIYENKNGDEVIETGNVKVSVAQDGTETIQIASHNNVRSDAVDHGVASTHKKVQNVQVASNPQKASECPGPNDLYVKLRIKVDHEFDSHGKYTLDDDDDDDDDDDSGEYWDEDSFTEGDEFTDYACLPRDHCYEFVITGNGKAFDPNGVGYAKLWVDNGDGTLRRLICLNAENNPEAEDDDDSGVSDPQCPDGEFETARTWFGCDCKEFGGYSRGCPEIGSDDDDDSAAGMNFVSPSSCQEAVLCDVGEGGNPSTAYPLGRCQGDCDENEDCQEGMICYERDDYDPVPGCSGEGSKDTNYCIEVVETSTHHHHTGN